MGHSRPLFLYFRLVNTVDSKQIKCPIQKFAKWLDYKREPLVLEETAPPTVPQPLPNV